MQRSLNSLVLALFIGTALPGCGGKKEAPQQTASAAPAPAPAAATKNQAKKKNKNKPSDKAASSPDRPSTSGPTGFAAPFPDRDNPFKRPSFTQLVKTNSASQEDVKLRGFINVNGMQALLAINGRIQPVQEGETRQGVQVIKIMPPNVILQKGRVRWTQKLFDTKSRPDALRAGLPAPPKAPF